MKTRNLVVPIVALLYFIFFAGLASAALHHHQPQKESPYVADFSYTPGSQAAPESAGVTFAVGAASYQSNKEALWPTYPQFEKLTEAMKNSLNQLLVAKGFGVRGPFDSYDLIPYSDKKAIDLWLAPKMELYVTLKDKKEKVESIWAAPPVYILSGTADVSGKLNVELREIVTNELMWAKNIPITFSFPYSVRVPRFIPGLYTDNKPAYGEKYGKPTPFDYGLIMNDLAKQVEEKYPELMATLSKLIDPEEMAIIKKQCQELKSKKGY